MPRRVIRRDGLPAEPSAGSRPAPPPSAVPPPDVSRVDDVIGDLDTNGNLIPVLQRLQERLRLPARAGRRRARAAQRGAGVAHLRCDHLLRAVLDRAERAAQGVRLSRHRLSRGRRRRGSPRRSSRSSASSDGETTPDMEFTLDSVACMGACSLAPVMRVDDETFGNLTPDQTRKVIRGVCVRWASSRATSARRVSEKAWRSRAMAERQPATRAKGRPGGPPGGAAPKTVRASACSVARRPPAGVGLRRDGVRLRRLHEDPRRLRRRGARRRSCRRGRRRHHRLPRALLAGPARGRVRRATSTTRACSPGRRRAHRRRAPRRRRGRRGPPLRRPGDRGAHRLRPRHPVLQAADAHRPARRRRDRPGEHRRVPRPRRLRGARARRSAR